MYCFHNAFDFDIYYIHFVSGANLEEPEVLINIVNFWFCLTDLLVALVQYVIKAL